jgi:hypothetical protein
MSGTAGISTVTAMSMGLRTATVLAALVGLAALSGCNYHEKRFDDSTSERVAITEIHIEGGSGDVVVHPGDPDRVDIHRTFEYDRSYQDPKYRIDGTVLRLDTRCGDRCSLSYGIRAPSAVKVTGHNGSGNLTASGVSAVDFVLGSGDILVRDATGPVAVHTTSGNVQVIDVTGRLVLGTSSGDVDATGVRSTEVAARTFSGNVRLELAAVADIQATTGSGDIQLLVPAGDYLVRTDTGSGDVDVRIATNPTGVHHVDLRTGSGNIAVDPSA